MSDFDILFLFIMLALIILLLAAIAFKIEQNKRSLELMNYMEIE